VHAVPGKIRANTAYNMVQAHQTVLRCDRTHRVGGIAGIVDTIYSTHRFAYSLPCPKVPGRDTLVPDYHTILDSECR